MKKQEDIRVSGSVANGFELPERLNGVATQTMRCRDRGLRADDRASPARTDRD
jgi:hypothetical protein